MTRKQLFWINLAVFCLIAYLAYQWHDHYWKPRTFFYHLFSMSHLCRSISLHFSAFIHIIFHSFLQIIFLAHTYANLDNIIKIVIVFYTLITINTTHRQLKLKVQFPQIANNVFIGHNLTQTSRANIPLP